MSIAQQGARLTDDDKEVLTFEQAVARLPDGDSVHTFVTPTWNVLVGADWSRDAIIEELRASVEIQVPGPAALGMGHGLACSNGHRWLFVQTRHEKG